MIFRIFDDRDGKDNEDYLLVVLPAVRPARCPKPLSISHVFIGLRLDFILSSHAGMRLLSLTSFWQAI